MVNPAPSPSIIKAPPLIIVWLVDALVLDPNALFDLILITPLEIVVIPL